MGWPFETSEAFITPVRFAELERRRWGLTPEEWALPSTLVATFQGEAYRRLLARAGAVAEGFGDLAVGEVGGEPCVLARIGIGAPAAAVLLEDSVARGVRDVLVVGSAGSLQPSLPVGSTVIVTGAEREDGTSHHYLPAGEVVSADRELATALEGCSAARGAGPVRGRSWTIDAPYRETVGAIRRHREAGVSVVEMEAAAIFAVARVRGVRAALIVAVSDELFGDEWKAGFRDDAYLGSLVRAADATMDVVEGITAGASARR